MKTIHWIILISLVGLLSSCDPCRPRIEGRVLLTDGQKQSIPYKSSDIAKFTDEAGHIIDFKVATYQFWTMDAIMEGGMCEDYWSTEGSHIILSSMSDDLKIEFWRRMMVYGFHRDKINPEIWRGPSCEIHIFMSINFVYPDEKTFLDFKLYVNEEGIFSTDANMGMHESLEINNHIYHDVIEQKRTIERANGKKIPTQLFYNKNYGILQIKVDNENFLMLNR